MKENRKIITQKANKIYKIVTKKEKHDKMTMFYKSLSCNFKVLEKKCKKYKS